MRYTKKIINANILEHIIVPFILIAGGVVSFFMYNGVIERQSQIKQAIFHDKASERISLIKLELQKIENFLKSVASVNSINKNQEMSAHSIITYSKKMREGTMLDLPLFVAPRLEHEHREAFETETSLLYGDAYGVVKIYSEEQTRFIPSPDKESYYPIRYVASFKDKDLVSIGFSDWETLGFDINNAEAGDIYVSSSHRLVHTSGQASIVLVAPIYKNKLDKEPSMIIITRFMWEDLLEVALKPTLPGGVDLVISEVQINGGNTKIHKYISRKNEDFYDSENYEFDASKLYTDDTILVGDKLWRIGAYPTLHGPYDINRNYAMYWLWCGLFVTGLLIKLIQEIILQKQKVSILVKDKTFALNSRTELLEIIVAGTAHEEVLRQVIGLVSDMYPDVKSGVFYRDYAGATLLNTHTNNVGSDFINCIATHAFELTKHGGVKILNELNGLRTNVYQCELDTTLVDAFRQERVYGVLSMPIESPSLGKLGAFCLFLPKEFDYDTLENKELINSFSTLCALSIEQAYNQVSKRDVESRFKALSEHESNRVAIFDDEFKFKYLSASFAKSLGLEISDLLGASYTEILSNSEKFFMKERLEYTLNNPGEEVCFDISPKNGYQQTCWEVIAIGMPNTAGVEGVMVNCREITDRKKTEEDLQESTRTIMAILDTIDGAVLRMEYITEASAFSVIFLSQGWQALSGCNNETFIGNGATKSIWDVIHPSDVSFVKEQIMDAIVYHKEFLFNMRVISQESGDVSHLWCQGFCVKNPRNAEHKIIEIVAIDVTKHQKIEERLKIKEKQLTALVDNVPGAVFGCHVDEKRTIEHISPYIEEMTGYTRIEFFQNPEMLSSLIHEDDLSRVYEYVRSSIGKNKSFNVSYRLKTKEGPYKNVSEYAKVYRTDKGVIMLEGVIFDVENT